MSRRKPGVPVLPVRPRPKPQAVVQAGSNVTLNSEQKTKIRETVINASSAPRVSNLNVSVSVGTVIPSSVRIVPVPTVLVEINPGWRGYEYFVYNDEIILVDPRTHRIIAILPV